MLFRGVVTFMGAVRALSTCSTCTHQIGMSWCAYRQLCLPDDQALQQPCWGGPDSQSSSAWRSSCPSTEYNFALCADGTTQDLQLRYDLPTSLARDALIEVLDLVHYAVLYGPAATAMCTRQTSTAHGRLASIKQGVSLNRRLGFPSTRRSSGQTIVSC